jgi:cytochrome c oxidase assembly protein subunit 15
MNGHVIPPEILTLDPWWRNFAYNMATVQLVHRAFFWLLLVLVPVVWWRWRTFAGANLLLAAFAAQAALGVATLLAGAPLHLAAPHQAGAVLVLAAAIWSAHASGARLSLQYAPNHAT